MGTRYILPVSVGPTLRAGRSIAQWLGTRSLGADTVIRYVEIDPDPVEPHDGPFHVFACEVYDVGHDELMDIGEFPQVDEDAPEGQRTTFATAEEAIRHACMQHGAHPERFVTAGLLPDEYADYLESIGGRAPPVG